MPNPAIGRIVHYVMEKGTRSEGQSRPAQITSVFAQPEAPPLLNLVVTLDGSNDQIAEPQSHTHRMTSTEEQPRSTWGAQGGSALHAWRTSTPHAEAVGNPPSYPPGTWHWPEGVA